jgi:hypothetical protein
LGDYKKIEMATRCVEQELRLQESIRVHDYSASEITSKLRRWIAILFPASFVLFVALLFLLPIGNAIWGWRVDQELYHSIDILTRWAFGSSLGAIILYYFPKGKEK